MVIYLYAKNNSVQIFNSKDEAFNDLGFSFIVDFVALYIGEGKEDSYVCCEYNNSTYESLCTFGEQQHFGDFCLRNEYGEVLTIIDFKEQVLRKSNPYVHYSLKTWNGEGPVPNTGKRGLFRKPRRGIRKPKSLDALRAANFFYEEEGEVPVRAKRSRNYIADIWNERPRSSDSIRNWKRYRKNQFK